MYFRFEGPFWGAVTVVIVLGTGQGLSTFGFPPVSIVASVQPDARLTVNSTEPSTDPPLWVTRSGHKPHGFWRLLTVEGNPKAQ